MIPMPELLTGSIKSGGLPEEYKLLHVSEAMDKSCLKADILAGASQFASLEDVKKSDIGKYVVVKADSEEEGLIAISYLHNILTGNNDDKSLELKGFSAASLKSWLDSEDEEYEDNDFDEDEVDIEDAASFSDALLDHRNIPIVSIYEGSRLINFKSDQFSSSPFSNMEAFAPVINVRQEPFWFNMHDRSICIVKHMKEYGCYYDSCESGIFDFFDDCKYTEFTMSEIIASVMKECEKGHTEGILMLDEFNCVSETILPTMLAFLQTKNIGEYKLPEGWCIVLAGNPPESNKSARSLDAALTDRVRKLSVEFKAEDFLEFAKEKQFHPVIVDFLNSNHSNIYVVSDDKKNMDPVTTRGWENLSNTLYVYEKMSEKIDVGLVNQFIKSDRVAIDFMNYYAFSKIGCEMKDLEKVFKGVELSEYSEKWSKYNAATLWSVIDFMGRILSDKVRGKSSRETVDNAITNIFELIERLKQPMLSERLFGIINQDDELIKLMTHSGNRKYVEACKKYCKVECF